MRNRFRPNVTPRSSRRSGPAGTSAASTSTTSCPSVSEPEECQREEESAVFIPPNSSKAFESIESTEVVLSCVEVSSTVQEPDKSIPNATSTETTTRTRRPRLKPSVLPTPRTRRKLASDAEKTTLQENESLPDVTADAEVVATTTTTTSMTSGTLPSKDTTTINSSNKQQPKSKPQSSTQPETPTKISKQTGNSVSTPEGSQSSTGSFLARRKRATPNIGAAARRRSSVSVPKESTSDKGTSQPESSVSQEVEEISDKTVPENEEVEERSNKRPRTASEPLLDNTIGVAEVTVESATIEEQPVEEQIIEQDEEEATNRRVEEKKRKPRHSRPKEPLDPSKMTLQDLIYFNPKSNPMKSSVDAKRRRIDKRKPSQSTESENGDANTIEIDGQDATDQLNTTSEQTTQPSLSSSTPTPPTGDEDRVHAPQVKIGADGCIILDEESLLIKSTPNSTLQESDIVYEDSNNLNYAAFKQSKRTKWSMPETLKFYKALSQVGTDFSLMLPLFPKRKRRELKAKFKREEKVHQDLVDRVLVHRTPITIEMFKRPNKPEEEEEEDILDDITSANDDRNNSTAK